MLEYCFLFIALNSVNTQFYGVDRFMKYPKSLLSLAIVTFGVILGACFQDELFSAYLFSLTGLGIIIPLTLIIGLVALGFVLARRRIGNLLRFSLVVGLSAIVSLFCFMNTGGLLNRWKINAVGTYVARAVPVFLLGSAMRPAYRLKATRSCFFFADSAFSPSWGFVQSITTSETFGRHHVCPRAARWDSEPYRPHRHHPKLICNFAHDMVFTLYPSLPEYGRGDDGLNRPNPKTNAANETNKGPTEGSGTATTVSTHTPGAADTDPSPTIGPS